MATKVTAAKKNKSAKALKARSNKATEARAAKLTKAKKATKATKTTNSTKVAETIAVKTNEIAAKEVKRRVSVSINMTLQAKCKQLCTATDHKPWLLLTLV